MKGIVMTTNDTTGWSETYSVAGRCWHLGPVDRPQHSRPDCDGQLEICWDGLGSPMVVCTACWHFTEPWG
jgi:hypothetical protein